MTEKSKEVQQFNELADQMDESLKQGEADARDVDVELTNSCLRRISNLRRAKIPAKLGNSPFHITEIDKAVREAIDFSGEWNENSRDAVFAKYIAALDLLSERSPVKDEDLADTAIFLRGIIIGLEQYRMKLERSLRHH